MHAGLNIVHCLDAHVSAQNKANTALSISVSLQEIGNILRNISQLMTIKIRKLNISKLKWLLVIADAGMCRNNNNKVTPQFFPSVWTVKTENDWEIHLKM